MRKIFFLLLCTISALGFSQQQSPTIDTVAITLNDAEDQFLKNNFALLAQKFNVDASKALVRQAGLFNNPNVYYENSVYNKYKTSGNKFFPTKVGEMGHPETQGEFIVQYNWLFSVAGKRNKSVKVAKAQADVAQYQFDDLMRTLLFALRSDFYQLHYGLQSLKLFDEEIASLNVIVTGFETQYQKGNVSLREITRVRALLFSMQNDRLALATDLRETLSEFAGLLNNPKPVWYKPTVNEAEVATKYNAASVGLSDLLTQALSNRPDLKAVQAQVIASEANLKLQNATGVPDVMLQGVYDRNGSYIPNYNAAAIQIPIAIFNRNQGNRQAAKSLVDAANQQLLQKQVSVQNDVFATYQKMIETEKLNNSLSANFATDFNSLLKGAQANFEKKNLSLLEFVDMFESYKTSMVQYNTIKTQRLTAFEELNFNVGKDAFKK
ncbi:MAG TPA: TolC family protein [Bacteroidia bacterium]|jgi:cobalt-zinc-cadmium efflux system outer membrane protein|nr:TolC family protein [Bacteroidia bacterium]